MPSALKIAYIVVTSLIAFYRYNKSKLSYDSSNNKLYNNYKKEIISKSRYEWCKKNSGYMLKLSKICLGAILI